MSNYDLYYPKERYDETEKTLHTSSEALYNKFRLAERSPDRNVRRTAINFKNQRQRFLDTMVDLSKEKQAQDSVIKFTNEEGGRFDREKSHWFAHGEYSSSILVEIDAEKKQYSSSYQ